MTNILIGSEIAQTYGWPLERLKSRCHADEFHQISLFLIKKYILCIETVAVFLSSFLLHAHQSVLFVDVLS